jgi:Tol biopolymer transport system component
VALAVRVAAVFAVGSAAVGVVVPVSAGTDRLVDVPACHTWDPAWSPDGSRIAFGGVGTPLDDGSGGLIQTVNRQGTELHVLTAAPVATASGITFHHDFEPAWSPDGRKLAFATDWRYHSSGRTWDQWSLSMLDTSTGAVTSLADSAADPKWSRTGLLGYNLYDGPYGDAAGFVAGSRTFPNPSTDVEWSTPSWSPDGSRFAFEADHSTGDRSEIYVMTSNGSYRPLVAGYGPRWSPDGRWIAYETRSGRRIDAISPNGKRHRHLLTLDRNNAATSTVVWSPNGAQIAIGTTIVTLATGRARNLPADGTGDYPGPGWSPDGRWLVYAGKGLQLIRPNGTGLRTINPCALRPSTN